MNVLVSWQECDTLLMVEGPRVNGLGPLARRKPVEGDETTVAFISMDSVTK